MIILNAETRSLKRASIVMHRVVGLDVSPNTIERIALEVGNDLEAAEQEQWQTILTGEVPVPSLGVVEFDGQGFSAGLPDGRDQRGQQRRLAGAVIADNLSPPIVFAQTPDERFGVFTDREYERQRAGADPSR